jgi:hypothetical protein
MIVKRKGNNKSVALLSYLESRKMKYFLVISSSVGGCHIVRIIFVLLVVCNTKRRQGRRRSGHV